jgi:hypothetical protein
MAAQFSEITQSDRELLEHILTDLHDVVEMLTVQGRMIARHDALLDEFRPLLNQFRSPLAAAMTRKARRG